VPMDMEWEMAAMAVGLESYAWFTVPFQVMPPWFRAWNLPLLWFCTACTVINQKKGYQYPPYGSVQHPYKITSPGIWLFWHILNSFAWFTV
jgi:hypothetical protein